MKPPWPGSVPCRLWSSAAAHAVAEHDHFLDFQHLHREFERGRDAVAAGRGFERGDHRGDIAHDEHFARVGVEHLGGVDAAVGTGDHHHLRRLAVAQFAPALEFRRPVLLAKAAIAVDQVVELGREGIGHLCCSLRYRRRSNGGNCA